MPTKNYKNIHWNLQFIVKKNLDTFIYQVIGGLVGTLKNKNENIKYYNSENLKIIWKIWKIHILQFEKLFNCVNNL